MLILRPLARRRAVRELESKSERVRFNAIASLGRMGGKRAVDILVEVAQPHLSGTRVLTVHQSVKYRHAAVHALRSRRAVPALIDALKDDEVVHAAVHALDRIGDHRATEALAALLRRRLSEAKPSDYPLCVAAVGALGSIGDHAAAPALVAALQPRRWGHLAPKEQSRTLEKAAAKALAAVGGTAATEGLVSHLAEHKDLFVAEALGQVPDVATVRKIVAPVARDIARGIEEPEGDIEQNKRHLATLDLLCALGPAGAAAGPEIVDAIARAKRPRILTQTLARISPLGDARAVDPILRSLFTLSRVSMAMAPFDDFETVLRGLIPVSTLTEELVTLTLDAVSWPTERAGDYSTATSDRAVTRLCQMKWRTASNILHLIARKQDESLRSLRHIDSGVDIRVHVSFAHQRHMAKAELARRNHETYQPDAYLLPGERASARAAAAEIASRLDSLLDHVKTDDSARRQFLDLLDELGKEHPLTSIYRRKLTSRLF